MNTFIARITQKDFLGQELAQAETTAHSLELLIIKLVSLITKKDNIELLNFEEEMADALLPENRLEVFETEYYYKLPTGGLICFEFDRG